MIKFAPGTVVPRNLQRGMDKRRSIPRWMQPRVPSNLEALENPCDFDGDEVWRQKKPAAKLHPLIEA